MAVNSVILSSVRAKNLTWWRFFTSFRMTMKLCMFKKLKSMVKAVKTEIKVYQLILKDRRTPRLAKWLLGISLGYLLMPFDIIPDFIPVLGQLDDIIIIRLLVSIAIRMIPKEVIADARENVR